MEPIQIAIVKFSDTYFWVIPGDQFVFGGDLMCSAQYGGRRGCVDDATYFARALGKKPVFVEKHADAERFVHHVATAEREWQKARNTSDLPAALGRVAPKMLHRKHRKAEG